MHSAQCVMSYNMWLERTFYTRDRVHHHARYARKEHEAICIDTSLTNLALMSHVGLACVVLRDSKNTFLLGIRILLQYICVKDYVCKPFSVYTCTHTNSRTCLNVCVSKWEESPLFRTECTHVRTNIQTICTPKLMCTHTHRETTYTPKKGCA